MRNPEPACIEHLRQQSARSRSTSILLISMPTPHPQAPIQNQPALGQEAALSPAAMQLDPDALRRLRELDPNGANKLIDRVVQAFNASIGRLMPELRAAQAAADAAGIRHVAHTLKSSSASIGAVKLSHMCAEMEAMARQDLTDGMQDRISALSIEIDAVLDALKRVLDSRP